MLKEYIYLLRQNHEEIIWPGIVAGIAILVLGMVISYLFMSIPSVAADYNNAQIMRSRQDPLMSLFFIYPFVLGIALAWVWNRAKGLFKGSACKRGTHFGLSYFIIATIPGMLISYSSFPLSLSTIICWTVSGLISAIAAGCILARMNK
jgi:hypothetical protein